MLLAAAACTEQPAGEPVVRTTLDGKEITAEIVELPEAPAPAPTRASACRSVSFEDTPLTHCIADPAQHSIAITYGPGDGSVPYGSLGAYAQGIEDTGRIAFAMNGGAFSDDLKPRGYLVASGARLAELDRSDGPEGNSVSFFMRPNGVFFGDGGTWRILTADRFYSTVSERPQFGTQSGPMLLIEGERHPAIAEDGNSRAIRNAVGVDGAGRAHFVISDAPLSYGTLARFFSEELGVANALFLDSKSSALWDPATGRLDQGRTGPIIVVKTRAQPAAGAAE
ncbi:MAG: phosphodiester glycosidase family protein [Erythrobacter sp.]|jgi:uncharacterized protein YigE (DUF2233 family)|nr:phosphodiester glycosidase family protein [Erythrobacter sp.]